MPEPTSERWLDVGGMSFYCRDWGGEGQDVILLHGLASNSRIWDLVAPLLAQHHRVVAVDQRGHGGSTKPDEGYDFASVGKDLLGMIQSLEMNQPLVVGHSWGADVALEFAVAFPEVPRALCFVDGGMIEPSARYTNLDEARQQMAPPIFAGMSIEAFTQRVRSRQQPLGLPPEAESAVLANFQILPDNTVQALLSRDNHLRIIDALWDHHPPELYPRVTCPVLLLPARQRSNPDSAERDCRREQSVARAAASLPRGKCVWMEDSIHDVPIQRPNLVAETILAHWDSGFFS